MVRHNPDEAYMLRIASSLPGVRARYATPEEDCGSRKADVVLEYHERVYWVQVSRQPKSRGEQERLRNHGTIPVATHRGPDLPYSQSELVRMLWSIVVGNEVKP